VSPSAPRLLVVQHEAGTGPGWWGGWLAEAGLELVTCHPYAGEDLPPVTAYDGVLVLGGAMGPSDDVACPWLPSTRTLLADAVAAAVPTFGICLGAELLVVACGGTVRRGAGGPELGVLEIEMAAAAAADALLSALPARPRVVQWHWEEMADLPPGAVELASSEAYRHRLPTRLGSLGRAGSSRGDPGHRHDVGPRGRAAAGGRWSRSRRTGGRGVRLRR